MPALNPYARRSWGIPTALNAEYYGQRTTAGLNITEATAISVQAHGYPQMPGMHSPEHVAGWRLVNREFTKMAEGLQLDVTRVWTQLIQYEAYLILPSRLSRLALGAAGIGFG